MKIGIDALALAGKKGGSVATYVVNLVWHMAKLSPYHLFEIYLSREALSLFSNFPENVVLVPVIDSSNSVVGRLFAEQFILPWHAHFNGIEVIFGTVQALPLLYIAMHGSGIVTIFDVRFLDRPQDFARYHRVYRQILYGMSVRGAASVIAISEFTRDRVNHHWNVAGKIHAIHLASGLNSEAPSNLEILNVRRKYGISRDYILTSANSPHKNVECVIDAFALLETSLRNRYMVVAFGACKAYAENLRKRAQDLGIVNLIVILDYIPESDVHALHTAATIFVFMSRYEGFGIPILDSMSVQVPVVCSNLDSLLEIVRHNENGLVVDLDDNEGLCKAIYDLLTDPYLRKRLVSEGAATVSKFSWGLTARRTLDVLERSCGTR